MDSLTFLQNANTNILSFINGLLFLELAIACICGVWQGFWQGEATAGKIVLLAAICAIVFRLWQSWPSEWVWFAVLPQCAFVVFAGGFVGCTFRWGVDRAFLRS